MIHPDCQAATVIYDDLWQEAMLAFQADQVQVDPYLKNRAADCRRGITLVARPSQEVCTKIERLQGQLQALLPGQYFYRRTELHVTILAPFTATAQPEPYFARMGAYRAAIDQALAQAGRFSLVFRGITATPGALMVQGFPQDSQLGRIRERLRAVLRDHQLTDGLETRYRITAAHITFMRFQTRPQDIPRLAAELGRYRAMEFGAQSVGRLQLTKNDWYMSDDRVELLKEYALE